MRNPQVSPTPICVNLDGMLIKTNTLQETVLALVRTAPQKVFLLPYWLMRGREYLWQKLSEQASINAALLPYRQEVLDYLRQEKEAGRELVLISGAHKSIVERVAEHLKIFDRYLLRNGLENAEYIDLPRRRNYSAIIKAMRPHQWAKNLLLFAAVFLSHKFNDMSLLLASAKGFVAFSLCGSAVYIINDLIDIEADRLHPRKRLRPFAAGDLTAVSGLLLSLGLLICAFAVAIELSQKFTFVLAIYFALTLIYSLHLKEKLLIDVFLLASLYVIRVWAGGSSTGIIISHWALAFFMCLFLSLALAKRHSELLASAGNLEERLLPRRGYRYSDRQFVLVYGCASSLMAVLVIALYINSPDVTLYYRRPSLLWFICPALAYWSGRLWIIATRGELDEDPLLYAIKDKVSYLIGATILAIVLIAI
ncbi:MAG: UbiA family prenyltransferase [Acidobacteria bacterium]|nr:UbiA family prenyltransferase [Acidobacteriota bacterium]